MPAPDCNCRAKSDPSAKNSQEDSLLRPGLYRIEAPHFVAGLLATHSANPVVCDAAPILAWMRRRPISYVAGYCQSKGWKLEHITDRPTHDFEGNLLQE